MTTQAASQDLGDFGAISKTKVLPLQIADVMGNIQWEQSSATSMTVHAANGDNHFGTKLRSIPEPRQDS